jgi:hypothetical protein
MAARNLRDDILHWIPRFVLIIDESLNRRGVLKYSAGRSTVTARSARDRPFESTGIDLLRRWHGGESVAQRA